MAAKAAPIAARKRVRSVYMVRTSLRRLGIDNVLASAQQVVVATLRKASTCAGQIDVQSATTIEEEAIRELNCEVDWI